ncbi:MAG: DUF1232 domain-containing protein [bacterium]|nr:DUF1232 domain-containing protein [bacterium]
MKFSKIAELTNRFSPKTILGFVLHLPSFLRLFSRLLDDPRVPLHLKLFCYASLAYIIFPFDLMPDLALFGLGYMDDVLFVYWAFSALVTQSPPEVVREHVEAISGRR